LIAPVHSEVAIIAVVTAGRSWQLVVESEDGIDVVVVVGEHGFAQAVGPEQDEVARFGDEVEGQGAITTTPIPRTNVMGAYRPSPSGVDIDGCGDTSGGYNVGYAWSRFFSSIRQPLESF
jgi:hypothetical protein